MKKVIAEVLGTFCLVVFGCGTAIFSGDEVGVLGGALAFGFVVISMIYIFGHVSGAHLNPAVSLGFWAAGQFESKYLLKYILSQFIGAVLGACFLYLIVIGSKGFQSIGDFAVTGYYQNGQGYGTANIVTAFVIEFVITFIFMFIILATTHKKFPSIFSGLIIGFSLIAIILFSAKITNASLNPARSFCQAIFADNTWAFSQLWLFFTAPTLGAILSGFMYKKINF